MTTVGDLLDGKSQRLHVVSPHATVMEAVERMNQHKIGCLMVMEDETLCGIITERDLLVRVLAQQRDPDTTYVRDIMTEEVIIAPRLTPMEEAQVLMMERRIRHLPVASTEGRLEGLVSIGDLNAFQARSQEATIYFLNEYIQGRV